MQNVQIEFWQDVSSLLFEMRISTVATALKKYLTMIISPPFFDIIVFLLSRINYPNRDFFHWQFFSLVFPLRNQVTSFLPYQSLSACKAGGYRE